MNIDYHKYNKQYRDFLEKYDWTCEGCLTAPFRLSNYAAYNAIQRMFKKISKVYPNYRMFCVAEPFASGGYHIHYLINIPILTTETAIKFAEMKWADSIGTKQRTNNKSRKYIQSKASIPYYLKSIMSQKIIYEFGGNF